MGSTDTSTLDQINQLSNERQRLWRLAGKQKLKPEQRGRIKDINLTLQQLWNCHRAEVASPHSEANRMGTRSHRTPDVAWMHDAWVWVDDQRSRSTTERAAIREAQLQAGYVEGDDLVDALVQGMREAVRELRIQDADAKGRVPLREKLAQRGETLHFMDAGKGQVFGIVVATT